MADDPTRLGEGDGELADAIRAAREVAPSKDERAALLATLPFIVGPPPAGPAGAPPPSAPAPTASLPSASAAGSAFSSGFLKAALVLLAVGAPALWWAQQGEVEAPPAVAEAPREPSETPTAWAPAQPPDVASNGGAGAPEAAVPEAAAPEAEPASRSAPSARRRRASRAPDRRPQPVQPEPSVQSAPAPSSEQSTPQASAEREGPSELSLLSSARRQLRTRPAEALALANRHRSEFGSGAFSEEREVLAIDALARLGRRAEAERRASRFERRWPVSVHNARISAILQR